MTEITFTSELGVDLVQYAGSDAMIASAARVSTGKDLEEHEHGRDAGLIGYLARAGHGSPFEHGSLTFRIDAPIFVAREFMRHRTGWSYNEVSGRYKKLEPKFYVYPEERPLVQEGSGAHPKLGHGYGWLRQSFVNGNIEIACEDAWRAYEAMLAAGAANEVARTVLPVGTYTQWYATCNPRSLMHFLSLRTSDSGESAPQWEIERIAKQMEWQFGELFPATYDAWVRGGRKAI